MDNFIIPGTDRLDPDYDEYWDDIEDECPEECEEDEEIDWNDYDQDLNPYFYC